VDCDDTFINWAAKAIVAGNFRHIHRIIYVRSKLAVKWNKRVPPMRFFVATLLATASFLAPVAGFAESADVQSTIKKVDAKNFSITLDDGKNYQAPEDFDFSGLQAGVKVDVFYTEVDGKRVINDLDILQ